MSLLDAFNISGMGLTAQRRRIEVISSNLANANTTRTAEGGPYRRKDVVFQVAPAQESFSDALRGELENAGAQGVQVAAIYEDDSPFIRRYEPNHPDADEKGYVSYPNVSPVEEMVNLLSASKSFEAGVQSINAIKDMARRSVEIGR
jgi:flagellar basal-body rod protein FlgC